MSLTKFMACLVAIAFVACTFAGTGFAQEQERQVEQFEAMLAKQAELDSQGAAAKDRAMAEKWLKEAKVLLASGDEEDAAKRLRRVEFALDLIRALVAASEIRKAAEEQEAAAYNAPERLSKLQDELDELKKRKSELQRQLRSQ